MSATKTALLEEVLGSNLECAICNKPIKADGSEICYDCYEEKATD